MSGNCNPCNENNGSWVEPAHRVFPAVEPSIEKRTLVSTKVKVAKTINDEVCIDCLQDADVVNCPQGTTQKLVPTGVSYCEEINGERTGFSITEYIDTNTCSATFGQKFPIKNQSINCVVKLPITINVVNLTCGSGLIPV